MDVRAGCPVPPGAHGGAGGGFKKDRRRPTLPPGDPGSTIGAEGLNGRVRNGNGCLPLAIATEKGRQFHSRIESFRGSQLSFVARCGNESGVKPHGHLVPVSSTHYCAYTPGLSTSSSPTGLQGARAPGRSRLEGGFPLRCFQRLSLPHLATGQCHWHDNPNTSGAFTPVLSY